MTSLGQFHLIDELTLVYKLQDGDQRIFFVQLSCVLYELQRILIDVHIILASSEGSRHVFRQ